MSGDQARADRLWLNVPFPEKETVKVLGARFDPLVKRWFVPKEVDARQFTRWLPRRPLTIELVPESCWFSNVRSNVTSAQWDTIRREVYQEYNHCCAVCGGKGRNHPVEAHEMWEYISEGDRNIQRLVQILALCPDCHQVKHIGLANKRGKLDQAVEHLMKINQISKEQADEIVADAFDLWQERSVVIWELDIKHLAQYGVDVSQIKQDYRSPVKSRLAAKSWHDIAHEEMERLESRIYARELQSRQKDSQTVYATVLDHSGNLRLKLYTEIGMLTVCVWICTGYVFGLSAIPFLLGITSISFCYVFCIVFSPKSK